MRRLIMIVSFAFAAISAYAQLTPERLLQHCRDSRVSLDYRYVLKGSVPVSGSGSLLSQGGCFRSDGNSLSIVCDSHTIWTIDEEAKEIYIESVAPGGAESLVQGHLRKMVSFNGGNNFIKGTVKDGDQLIEISLSNIEITRPEDDYSAFRIDISTYDQTQWLITDLR